ncbi:MAG: DUF5672 family protein [Ramlibacter sp.]|uniref:DUF5672 family protein n=1 Tax=Ramlibacter sp. TaxID=1917967 RepID=UPI0026227F7A|nr:DUF5672 family protein [Ramlibacter sp.]MDH4377513.1 DUF5672 family protein [Ramlibacter sp.]
MQDLSQVTLCAADCVTPALAGQALDRCLAQCDFGEALLLSHEAAPTQARWTRIDPLRSIADYNAFMLGQLIEHVRTPYVLVVQWDGFVLDASQWRSCFLDFDYIGARWPWHPTGSDVGNGGFSLRSRRLLEALASPGFVHADAPEDDLICRRNRPYLEQAHGIRFAPAEVAERFAYENGEPQRSTFGFHGLFNLWRHLDEGQVLVIADSLPARTCLSKAFVDLQMTYLQQRKYWMVGAMYRLMTRAGDRQAVLAAYGQAMPDAEVPEALVSLCERLIQGT